MIPIKDNIPTDRFPLITVALILANFVVYILAVRHGGSLIAGPTDQEVFKYGAIPLTFTHPGVHCREIVRELPVLTPFGAGLSQAIGEQCGRGIPAPLPVWETVFTAMFMHASILHIAGNMLFLWIFGNNVEDSMGRLRFLAFYIAGGLAAFALQVAVDPNSPAPTLGASGAIAAVLGGYIVLYPGARVLTLVLVILFFTVIELPAWVMLGVWFAEQALFGAANLTNPTGGGGGVAYFAHVGGFLFGLLFIRIVASRRKAVPPPYPVY